MIRAVVLTESFLTALVLWIDRRVLARRWIRPWLLLATGLGIGMLCLISISPWIEFVVNRSASLPGRVYLLLHGVMPNCNDRFVYRMPSDAAYLAGKRMLKIAAGCPGSRVSILGRHVYIDGRDVGAAKPLANNGDALAALGRSGVLPKATWYAHTPHPDSFDSRYAAVGWITRERVLGRAIRLF